MLNLQKKDWIPFVLAASLALSGCHEKVECDVSNRHFHRYHKDITENIGIDTYLEGEYSSLNGYERTEDYIELTKQDENVYHLLEKLMVGEDNFDYLYYFFAYYYKRVR